MFDHIFKLVFGGQEGNQSFELDQYHVPQQVHHKPYKSCNQGDMDGISRPESINEFERKYTKLIFEDLLTVKKSRMGFNTRNIRQRLKEDELAEIVRSVSPERV